MTDIEHLQKKVEDRIQSLQRQEREKSSLLAQTKQLGTLSLLLTLPIVGGAYFGLWIDSKQSGYSFLYTVSGLVGGVVFGLISVYLFVMEDS